MDLFDTRFTRTKPPKIKRGDTVRVVEGGRTYEVSVTNVDPQLDGDRIEGMGRLIESEVGDRKGEG